MPYGKNATMLCLKRKKARVCFSQATNSNKLFMLLRLHGVCAMFSGTIGFIPKASILPDFEAYFRNIRLKDRSGGNSSLNPWFAPYLSKQLGCDLQGIVVIWYALPSVIQRWWFASLQP